MQAMREYWAKLTERERLILGGGAAFLILALLYLLLWQPLLDARTRLAKLLPRQQQTLQTAQLGGAPAAAMLDVEQVLAQAGGASGIVPANKQTLSPQRVKLSFEAVSFSQWLNFAGAMQANGWPVSVMDVTRGEAGKVKVVAEFGR